MTFPTTIKVTKIFRILTSMNFSRVYNNFALRIYLGEGIVLRSLAKWDYYIYKCKLKNELKKQKKNIE